MRRRKRGGNHVVDHHPGSLPKGAMPLHEAMFRFVPDNLWREYQCAVEAEKQAPDEAQPLNQIFQQMRSARAAVDTAWHAIESVIVEQLIAGDLTAIVQSDPPFGEWRPILSEDWRRRLRIQDARKGHVTGPNIDLNDVHIVEGHRSQLYEPVPRGARGRRSSKDLILGEHRRRVAAKEAHPVQRDEALALVAWLKRAHRKATQMRQRRVARY
jgi:hypothetical protein